MQHLYGQYRVYSPPLPLGLILYREKFTLCHVVRASGSQREQRSEGESRHLDSRPRLRFLVALRSTRNDISGLTGNFRDFLHLENQPYLTQELEWRRC